MCCRSSTPLAEIARRRELPEADLTEQMDAILARLEQVRQQRPRPATDTKILTAWNGLMIRGMADVGSILGDDRYIDAATRAADFVLTRLRAADGRLLRSYRDGQAKLDAYLEDYALLVDALIALDRVTGEAEMAGRRARTDRPANRTLLGRTGRRLLLHIKGPRHSVRPQQADDR